MAVQSTDKIYAERQGIGGVVTAQEIADLAPGVNTGSSPILSLYKDDDQSANATSATALSWNKSYIENTAFTHSTSTNNSRIQVPSQSIYLVFGNFGLQGTTSNYRLTLKITVAINGGAPIPIEAMGGYVRANGSNNGGGNFFFPLPLNAGDYFEVFTQRISSVTGDGFFTSGTSICVFLPTGPVGPEGPAGANGGIATTDYATATVGGTVKMRIDGTDLYITNDGSDA